MNKLTFAALREANVLRLPQFKNKHGELAHKMPDGSDWSISDWIECVTGELGELANLHKKFRCGDVDAEKFLEEGRKELADIQIYLDILAFQMKQDLGQCVEDKFNEVSKRVQSNIILDDGVICTDGILPINMTTISFKLLDTYGAYLTEGEYETISNIFKTASEKYKKQ